MSITLAKKKPLSEAKTEIRSSQDWMDRVDRHAHRVGLSRSAYIRLVVTQVMDDEDRESAERQEPRGKKE